MVLGNTKLIDYGIQSEKSDMRAHVSMTAKKVFVYPTVCGLKTIEDGEYPFVPVKTRGIVTAKGYLVPPSDIPRMVPISIPRHLLQKYYIAESDDQTTKGNKAVAIVQAYLLWGWFPLPTSSKIVKDVEMQRDGLDLYVKGNFKIQVKCDRKAGTPGTGNLFLQTEECNPFGYT